MGEFNWDDYYIYYCGQESLRRNEVVPVVNKRIQKISIFGCNLKNDTMISVHFQGKPFNVTVIQVYAPTTNAKEAKSWIVLWWCTRPSRTNTKKWCAFHHGGLECKSWKPRDTWNNRQVWSWCTKWNREKANRVLPRKHTDHSEHTDHSKHPLPTTQEKTLHMDITRWSILKLDWLYSLQSKMEKLDTISRNKSGSWLWLRLWTPYCQIQT